MSASEPPPTPESRRGASSRDAPHDADGEAGGALAVVGRGLADLNTNFVQLLKVMQDEKAQLAKDRASLERERAAFEDMRQRVEAVNDMQARKVKLNVGGQTFETTTDTITAEPGSMLEAMFSGRFHVERDSDTGACFIDRDPTHFPLILCYLRSRREGKPFRHCPALTRPETEGAIIEANYFGLVPLERTLMLSLSIVVARDGSGQFRKIGDALNAANDGDTIVVQPGTYYESLVFNKSVDVIGNGKDVVLCYAGGHVVTLNADSPSLKDIEVHQQGREHHCLFITDGGARVEGCTFTSSGWACVGISGEGTHPHLLRNRLPSSSDNGIIILSKGKGLIEHNEIFKFALQGIEIREASNPIIRHNVLYNGGDSGIYINTNGQGVVEHNVIHSNQFNGIAVKFQGNPSKIAQNVVYDNNHMGIFVSADSSYGEGSDWTNNVYNNRTQDTFHEEHPDGYSSAGDSSVM
eukprot:TRINITY_DN10714_c0_g1_i2.p1 TRINITY_DN10714_c0_g1~~TRINITY_DN10714_c0_g1_i2.p1  ORF type:complete len:467 (+),score=159.33 TRINITY_DN10714_c0_g1_i2:107-1507(+)